MILVIGGRSKIGTALIAELVARGERVRALVRSGESKRPPADGVETVTGDLSDVGSLRTAVAGAERMFLLCGPAEAEVELNRNAIDVARDSGVRLLVRSSILGADTSSTATFSRDHGACDAYLRGSGVPHVIVRPNMFTENIPESTIPSIDADGNFYVNAGDARISMVRTGDIASVAAAVLTEPGHEGRAYDVTGPEALSYHDVAAKLSDAMSRKVTYVDAPDDAIRSALLGLGVGVWLAGALTELFADYRRSGTDGYAAQLTDTVQRLTGRPPSSLDRLLADQPSTAAA
jgi:uncharacterized protein YbjT (DUF2867 family)